MLMKNDVFLDEIKFFGIDSYLKEDISYVNILFAVMKDKLPENYDNFKTDEEPNNKYKKCIWKIFEQPNDSLIGRIFAFICFSTVIISVISICWETVIESNIKQQINEFNKNKKQRLTESTQELDIFISLGDVLPNNNNNTNISELFPNIRKFEFFIIELICNTIFTIELGLRFFVSRRKLEFAKSLINIIDAIAILPFWAFIILFFLNVNSDKINYFALSFLKVLRLTRVLRVFKLSRHIRVLNILVHSISQCIHEIILLITILAINVIIFSSFMYHIEQQAIGNDSKFLSIPHTFWWSIISFTTVGYG